MLGLGGEIRELNSGTQRRGGTRHRRTSRGLTGTWVQAKDIKGGNVLVQETAEDVGTQRWGTGTSGGGCKVAGAVEVQVGSAYRRERIWGAGANRERDMTMKGC